MYLIPGYHRLRLGDIFLLTAQPEVDCVVLLLFNVGKLLGQDELFHECGKHIGDYNRICFF